MKKTLIVCGFLLLTFFSQQVFAQNGVRGTEEPAVYLEKEKILMREQRMRQSQAIQEVARIYREMVSSYKARRIVRAEELSQDLGVLLDDPILPEAFAERISHKQQKFLKRVYGDRSVIKIDVPVDEISDEEVTRIQQVINTENIVAPSEAVVKASEPVVDRKALKQEARAVRLAERESKRQVQVAERKRRRDEKLALKESRKNEKIARREARKLKKTVDIKPEAQNLEEVVVEDIQEKDVVGKEMDDVVMAKRREIQEQKLIEYQNQYFDLEREEVDRYVRLYEDQLKDERLNMEKELAERIDSLYQDGIEFLEKKAYSFSYDVFKEVEKLAPDYKLTRQYLKELEYYFHLRSANKTLNFTDVDSTREKIISESLNSYHP